MRGAFSLAETVTSIAVVGLLLVAALNVAGAAVVGRRNTESRSGGELLAAALLLGLCGCATVYTPLMKAARADNLAQVKALLAKGADPNKENANGATALSIAVYDGHLKVVWALLEAGGKINKKLIRLARTRHHTLILRTLLKPPMELNRPKAKERVSPKLPKISSVLS